jgi:hypothetical protein
MGNRFPRVGSNGVDAYTFGAMKILRGERSRERNRSCVEVACVRVNETNTP